MFLYNTHMHRKFFLSYIHKPASLVLGVAEVAGVGISEERNKMRVDGVL
jgi:hypothetical protein